MGKGTQHMHDWTPTKLQAIVDAKRLASYTSHIVKNVNVFKPEDDFNDDLRTELVHTSRSVYTSAWSANRISVKDNETSEELFRNRLDLQTISIRLCGDLLALIEIAWSQFHLPSKKVKNWGSMVLDVESKLIGWHKSDTERFREYKKKHN